MGWMRDNRDALVISVIGGLLVTVGGGVILSGVLPGGDAPANPIVVEAPAASKPTVITVKVPTPTPPSAKTAVTKKQATKSPPPSTPPPAQTAAPVTSPSPLPPPIAPPPPPPTTAAKVVATKAGSTIVEGTRATLMDGRLKVALGNVSGGTISRVTLQAGGKSCSFARVRESELLGVRVTARGVVGVRVIAVTAKGATVKAAATRVPRRSPDCPRGTS